MKQCAQCHACADDAVGVCPNDGSPLTAAFPGGIYLDRKYKFERRLGQGGMGVVYRAHHLGLHRAVAIKILSRDDRHFAERFQLEAAALGQLKHPHIVDVMDFGFSQEHGFAYLVMELLDGVTLSERCRSRCPARKEAITILEQIAAAVDYAHTNGILHRDLKPSNVFLSETHGRTVVKILDFGLAQFVALQPLDERINPVAPPTQAISSDSETTTADLVGNERFYPMSSAFEDVQRRERLMLMGTYGYMAPELFSHGPATRATDLYAFGVIAYQLVAGALPTNGPAGNAAAPSLVSNAARELDPPIMALLEPDAAQRPATAGQAVAAIRQGHRTASQREWVVRERPRRSIAAVACALAAAAAGTLWVTPAIERLEHRAMNGWFHLMPPRAADPRLLVVTVDDRSLEGDPTPLSLRADEFGARLSRLFEAGVRAVGVDLLLPETWSRSGSFARLLVRHAERVTLAAFSTPSATVVGPECLPGVARELLGVERAADLFGFVNIESGPDGVARRFDLTYRSIDNGERKGWAWRLASAAQATDSGGRRGVWIDYSVDPEQIDRIAWIDLPNALATNPRQFAGRIVLVGAQFAGSGDDNHRLPNGSQVAGLIVQALAVNTILAGFPIRQARIWPSLAGAAAVAGITAFLLLMYPTPVRGFTVAGVAIVINTILAGGLFAAGGILLRVVGPAFSIVVAAGLALVFVHRWHLLAETRA